MSQQNSSLFGSLKKKLSRRSSNPLAQNSGETNKSSTQGGFLAPSNNNPFPSGAPPTRHPSGSRSNPFTRQSAPNDPPPAYTPSPANPASILPGTNTTTATDDDPYAFLRTFDTIFLIDDSGSMAGSRWRQVEQALKIIAPICASRDEDGVDVWFLNDKRVWMNQRTAGNIVEIFQDAQPRGLTFTGQRLNQMLTPYLARYRADPRSTKPVNVIVITDGDAHDDVAGAIEDVARALDRWEAPPWQVGIQFFQIGNDAGAREMLKDLDDHLGGSGRADVRDIVDTVPFTSETGGELSAAGIMKVVLGSVNRRLDRSSRELHRS